MIFAFGWWNGEVEHWAGDERCPACWQFYPQHCIEVVDGQFCGGLVHAHFGDEDYDDGGYWTETMCERCREVSPDTVEA